MGKCENSGFSETIAACDLKLVDADNVFSL